MAKFRLAVGLHNHQPVGNFDHIFEFAHRRAYAAFLNVVKDYESFRFSLHQSGILWDWQEHRHDDYLERVRRMAVEGRLELMTGGFYEPILTSIPERDVCGQIEMLNAYLGKHFNVRPEGLWLTERIWEPHLPKVLARMGVKYVPLDDTHFIYAGLEASQLTGPFVTEDEGHTLTLLPIQKRLRYLIPFGTVEAVIDELKNQADRRPEGLAIYADDGEKFGVWPRTHEHCYRDGWLRDFFEALEKNSDWLEVIPLSEAAAEEPAGRVYLPSASYAEMLHWALPTPAYIEYERLERWLKDYDQMKRFGRFMRGGHWRGFLTKYEESNLMHKKMLALSERLARYEAEHPDDLDHTLAARRSLYGGQCNCSYWHGVFGGLYLPHIRQAVHECLIHGDHLLNQLEERSGVEFSAADFDFDGNDEVICRSQAFTAVFKPRRGAALYDLSLNRHDFSPTDTLTRRREGYHGQVANAVTEMPADTTASIHDIVLAKEKGLEKYLIEDWYLKRCFIDHFLTGDVDLARFASGKYGEEGDFIVEAFEYETDPSTGTVTFTRDGHLWRPQKVVPVRVVKEFRFTEGADEIAVRYRITADSDDQVQVNFAIENNLNLQDGHSDTKYLEIDGSRPRDSFLDTMGEFRGKTSLVLKDEDRDLAIGLVSDRPSDIWQLPIFSVSLSEAGFEKTYQGTTILSFYRTSLTRRPFEVNFAMYAGALSGYPSRTLGAASVGS